MIHALKNSCLDLLFPRRCPVCDRPVKPVGALICRECRRIPRYVSEPRCLKCGKGLRDGAREFCYDCARAAHRYEKGIVLYEYRSVQSALYRFKYGNRQEYAAFFGRDMADCLGKTLSSWRPDALVPVPLHPKREEKRGYNQAALLAREMGKLLQIPVLEGWLVRVENTRPQKELAGSERQNNLKKAFKLTENDVKLNTIVIIDDIYTTGSTVDEIAGILRRAGVRYVYFAALSAGNGM